MLIVQNVERAFKIIVLKEKQLHKNVEKNIVECARTSTKDPFIYFFLIHIQ